LKEKLFEQIGMLRKWDLRWGVSSVPTSLAVFWGGEVRSHLGPAIKGIAVGEIGTPPADQLLQWLADASDKLTQNFGAWKTPWGDINRFQRLNDDISPNFSDSAPSIPVGFTSSQWGSLASFGARAYPGTKKWYGASGNSFVAVVEFGDRVRARAVTAGGESGRPGSAHFDDEAKRYSTGDLREVYFYPAQLQEHTEREYHPGS
jgi:acyl-homoserine-lactone acylase